MVSNGEEGAQKPDRSDLPVEVAKFTKILDEKVHEAMMGLGEGIISATSMTVSLILFMSDILGHLESLVQGDTEAELLLAKGNRQMRGAYVPFLLREVLSGLREGTSCKETEDCVGCPFISLCKDHMDKHPEDMKLGTPENWQAVKERIERMF